MSNTITTFICAIALAAMASPITAETGGLLGALGLGGGDDPIAAAEAPPWSGWRATHALEGSDRDLALVFVTERGAEDLSPVAEYEWRTAYMDLNGDGVDEAFLTHREPGSYCMTEGTGCYFFAYRLVGEEWQEILSGFTASSLTVLGTVTGDADYRDIETDSGRVFEFYDTGMGIGYYRSLG